MAEIEIENILKVLKAVNNSHVKDMHIRYDQEADTMYVNLGHQSQRMTVSLPKMIFCTVTGKGKLLG